MPYNAIILIMPSKLLKERDFLRGGNNLKIKPIKLLLRFNQRSEFEERVFFLTRDLRFFSSLHSLDLRSLLDGSYFPLRFFSFLLWNWPLRFFSVMLFVSVFSLYRFLPIFNPGHYIPFMKLRICGGTWRIVFLFYRARFETPNPLFPMLYRFHLNILVLYELLFFFRLEELFDNFFEASGSRFMTLFIYFLLFFLWKREEMKDLHIF